MRTLLLASLVLLGACANVPQVEDRAVEDFIRVSELPTVSKIRSDSNDQWEVINERYIAYDARRESYLIEFKRDCYDIDTNRVVPDVRREGNVIRAKFDTIRGCRIGEIYGLTEQQREEVEALGEAPGSRL